MGINCDEMLKAITESVAFIKWKWSTSGKEDFNNFTPPSSNSTTADKQLPSNFKHRENFISTATIKRIREIFQLGAVLYD